MSERRCPSDLQPSRRRRPRPNHPTPLTRGRPAAMAGGPEDAADRSATTTDRSPSTSSTLPEQQPLELPDAAHRASTSSPTASAPRSAPGTATSGSSAGSTNRLGGLTWQRIASGLFQPLGLKVVDGPDLRLLPRPDRAPARPQRRRRDRLLRVLQQRPPGHRALPRVRDGPADRRRGELLLRQGGAARPAGRRPAARHAAEGQQGRRSRPRSSPPASAPRTASA